MQGDTSDGLYGIIKGKITLKKKEDEFSAIEGSSRTILKNSSNNLLYRDYLEKDIATLGSGSVFGEWGFLNKEPRNASAYAEEDTDLFFLEKEYYNTEFIVFNY